jgi:hypothetical protein
MSRKEQIKTAYGLYRQHWRLEMRRVTNNADPSYDWYCRMIAGNVVRNLFDDNTASTCATMFEDRTHEINYFECFVSPRHLYRCTHTSRGVYHAKR